MKSLAKQYGVVFLIGLVALVYALAYSTSTTGELFDGGSFIFSLRTAGLGFIACGMAMWAAQRREEAGKSALTPLFGFLVLASIALLVLSFFYYDSELGRTAGLGGLGFGLAAMLIAVISMLFFPAFPKPIAKRWPVGAEATLTRFAEEDDAHHHDDHSDEADHAEDDLTKIEGIGPKLQSIFYAAGFKSFSGLAGLTAEKMSEIVEAADFKAPFNPATWARQAELAANEQWDELAVLQEELYAGRE